MNRAVRTGLALVISVVLLSALSMAQSSSDKDTNKQHHSRLAKVAFWRHPKDGGTKQKQAQPNEKSSDNHAPAAQLKPTSAKTSAAKSPAPNTNQKQVQHAAVNKKPAAKSISASKSVNSTKTEKSASKASTPAKTTPRKKAPAPQAVSFKQ